MTNGTSVVTAEIAHPCSVMVVLGTRPEAVKLAPIILGLRDSSLFEPCVVVTGQHREMLDQVLEVFDIRSDVDLDLIQPGQTLTDVTVRALSRLSPVIAERHPEAVVVQGDTTTTFAGALAAFYHQVPVAHVEAGLRTDNPYSPYPEEINRRLTTQLATLHLAPTPTARGNLLRDGVDAQRVIVTGNSVIDALRWAVDAGLPYGDPALDGLDDDPRRVLLVTAHRRESWGRPMQEVGRALADLAASEPDLLVVFPIHRNPVVREAVMPHLAGHANVVVTEPLPYGGFARLIARSHLILTDSGGIQEEGPSLGKPVLVMRDTTERPEAVEAGTAALVGIDRAAIRGAVRRLLHDRGAYEAMANAVNPYGDGRAAERTVAALAHLLAGAERPEEFKPEPSGVTPLPAANGG
ncbi:MAG TPA: UDP-N-acetylglucosamine 2-epimerase (non-hydrolyzing) [Acidimicrobiales bacterium]|nr:UDP-N-acetylglucosamine 2-epimerase (non-hydrolyzing) [Acidimicrobiales bacterium]